MKKIVLFLLILLVSFFMTACATTDANVKAQQPAQQQAEVGSAQADDTVPLDAGGDADAVEAEEAEAIAAANQGNVVPGGDEDTVEVEDETAEEAEESDAEPEAEQPAAPAQPAEGQQAQVESEQPAVVINQRDMQILKAYDNCDTFNTRVLNEENPDYTKLKNCDEVFVKVALAIGYGEIEARALIMRLRPSKDNPQPSAREQVAAAEPQHGQGQAQAEPVAEGQPARPIVPVVQPPAQGQQQGQEAEAPQSRPNGRHRMRIRDTANETVIHIYKNGDSAGQPEARAEEPRREVTQVSNREVVAGIGTDGNPLNAGAQGEVPLRADAQRRVEDPGAGARPIAREDALGTEEGQPEEEREQVPAAPQNWWTQPENGWVYALIAVGVATVIVVPTVCHYKNCRINDNTRYRSRPPVGGITF